MVEAHGEERSPACSEPGLLVLSHLCRREACSRCFSFVVTKSSLVGNGHSHCAMAATRQKISKPLCAPFVLPATFSFHFALAATLCFRQGYSPRTGNGEEEGLPGTALP